MIPDNSRRNAINVLHVDDESAHLIISKKMLEQIDNKLVITTTTSPQEVLDSFSEYDCIVCYYRMPGMNGIELAQIIKQETKIPFILYTGQGSEEVAEAAFAAGIDDYLRKEIDLSHYRVLSKKISMATERHRFEKERILHEKETEITLKVLQILNMAEDSKQVLSEVLDIIQEYIGTEVIALRLNDGEDYPYYHWNGFSDYFVKMESSLCSKDEGGNTIRDDSGIVVLECMCGNVIRSRFDSELPFFSEYGSFWTNSTTQLLASTSEEDRQAKTRNMCNSEGYESVALIPIKSQNNIIGLFQLNDESPNKFDARKIRFLEGLGSSLGIAIKRVSVPENLLVQVMNLIAASKNA